MNPQEIYRKRIEEGGNTFVKHSVSQGHGHCTEFYARRKATLSFKEGASYILENLWIPVNESLPEIEEIVLVCIFDTSDKKDHTYNVGFFTGEKQLFFLFGYGTTEKVTHWMPIPSLKISNIANQGEVSHIWKDGSGRLISDYERNIAVEKYKIGGVK